MRNLACRESGRPEINIAVFREFDEPGGGPARCRPTKENRMGRGDNRRTLKMKRKRSQSKLKARIKRKIDTARAAKKPAAAPAKKK
jgi:hypothetical protein